MATASSVLSTVTALAGTALPLAVLVLASFAAARWMARRRDLGLTLFRPWRGDAWPHGVQEDDDFRFNWSPVADEPPDLEPTDLSTAGLTVERPGRIEVHRRGGQADRPPARRR